MWMVVGFIAAVVAIVAFMFPGFAAKLKVLGEGTLNIFVEDMASSEEGIRKVSSVQIEKATDNYNQACRDYERNEGEKKALERQINDLKKSIDDNNRKCESFGRAQDWENVELLANKIAEDTAQLNSLQDNYASQKENCENSKMVRDGWEKLIKQKQAEADNMVNELRNSKNKAKLIKEMDKLRAESADEKLMQRARENVEKIRMQADGAVAAYSTKTSTRLEMADKKAAAIEASEYVAMMKRRYGNHSVVSQIQDGNYLPSGNPSGIPIQIDENTKVYTSVKK